MTNESVTVGHCSMGESMPSSSGVRFNLKKRTIRSSRDMVNMSSYNSAFLSGLFADVAKATEITPTTKRGSELISSEPPSGLSSMEAQTPSKKSRLSLNRSMSRSPVSMMNLSDLAHLQSPKGVDELFAIERRGNLGLNKSKVDSLAFQLNCLATDSSSNSSDVDDTAKLTFPHLPATVSDSSCSSGLTRAKLIRNVSNPENDTKECFGWFVDLDDNHTPDAPAGLPNSVSNDDLAFQAPTAPKRVNDEAELEWAKAADTVDDVLGDFF